MSVESRPSPPHPKPNSTPSGYDISGMTLECVCWMAGVSKIKSPNQPPDPPPPPPFLLFLSPPPPPPSLSHHLLVPSFPLPLPPLLAAGWCAGDSRAYSRAGAPAEGQHEYLHPQGGAVGTGGAGAQCSTETGTHLHKHSHFYSYLNTLT